MFGLILAVIGIVLLVAAIASMRAGNSPYALHSRNPKRQARIDHLRARAQHLQDDLRRL